MKNQKIVQLAGYKYKSAIDWVNVYYKSDLKKLIYIFVELICQFCQKLMGSRNPISKTRWVPRKLGTHADEAPALEKAKD